MPLYSNPHDYPENKFVSYTWDLYLPMCLASFSGFTQLGGRFWLYMSQQWSQFVICPLFIRTGQVFICWWMLILPWWLHGSVIKDGSLAVIELQMKATIKSRIRIFLFWSCCTSCPHFGCFNWTFVLFKSTDLLVRLLLCATWFRSLLLCLRVSSSTLPICRCR